MDKVAKWVLGRIIALLIWAGFVVGFSVLPIAAVYFLGRLGGTTPGPELLFGEGQALLLAGAISADAIGRIVSGIW